MPKTITMPALSPTMTEGTLASWSVKEGDEVAAGDVIAEIETDKATMEVEAVDEGRIARILVPAGSENVAVNTPIAILLEEGEDESALEGFTPEAGGGAVSAETPLAETPAPSPAPAPAQAGPASAQPAAVQPSPVAASPAAAAGSGARIFASPLARRMAEQAGLDLAAIKGSGPNGRIVKRDIEAALAAGKAAPAAAAPAPAETVAAPAAPAIGEAAPLTDDYEEVPLNNMRRTIARRLSESKQTVPHFYLSVDVELDKLLALRKDLNSRSDDYKISVNDFIVRASALALRKNPDVNAQWTDKAILRHRKVDISVAVAIDGGLITPIVRDADRKGLAEIANETKDLAARAREGKLMPEEYQGGTFSISNLGMFGIDQFVAVINPPQAAILAVGQGMQKAVVRDGAVAVATVMSCTLSCDHRVFGGAEGAKFLQTFKGLIEDPVTMLL